MTIGNCWVFFLTYLLRCRVSFQKVILRHCFCWQTVWKEQRRVQWRQQWQVVQHQSSVTLTSMLLLLLLTFINNSSLSSSCSTAAIRHVRLKTNYTFYLDLLHFPDVPLSSSNGRGASLNVGYEADGKWWRWQPVAQPRFRRSVGTWYLETFVSYRCPR